MYETHGNAYQSGFPDLFAIHHVHGSRWIEVKNPKAYSFTVAQRKNFLEWTALNVGIYVLIDASESEYKKLFGPANLLVYFK